MADASDEALVAQLADMMKANPDKDYDNVLRRAKETCKERMLQEQEKGGAQRKDQKPLSCLPWRRMTSHVPTPIGVKLKVPTLAACKESGHVKPTTSRVLQRRVASCLPVNTALSCILVGVATSKLRTSAT